MGVWWGGMEQAKYITFYILFPVLALYQIADIVNWFIALVSQAI